MFNVKISPETTRALRLYVAELEKIQRKYQKKKDAQLALLKSKTGDADETELSNLYGYGYITKKEYYAALDKLRERKDYKSAAAELLRMVSRDIRELRAEIAEIDNSSARTPV